MNRLEIPLRTLAAALVAFIVIGGFAVALLTMNGSSGMQALTVSPGPLYSTNAVVQGAANSGFTFGSAGGSVPYAATTTVTMSTTTAVLRAPSTVVVGQQSSVKSTTPQSSQTSSASGNGSRLVEFFSNVTMESSAPSSLASRVIELAYSVGGYVAYQSTFDNSAYVIVRVPASTYQQVLTEIQSMGNVTSLTSNSNDVTVQYTNLNATLVSLVAEQQALLRLVNTSTSVNATLEIEAQLQSVNAQINFVQSEILQTQRLVTYSTLTVSISKSSESKPLTMTLSATPKSGVSPLGVTFNAIVSGGHAPYIVNYNFGDGTSQEGQVVIHEFYGAGAYNVTVTATDQTGSVTMASAIIDVKAAPTPVGFGDFPAALANLFIRVVEGMAEVAVIVLPAALVLAAVIVPLRRRSRVQKQLKQS